MTKHKIAGMWCPLCGEPMHGNTAEELATKVRNHVCNI